MIVDRSSALSGTFPETSHLIFVQGPGLGAPLSAGTLGTRGA